MICIGFQSKKLKATQTVKKIYKTNLITEKVDHIGCRTLNIISGGREFMDLSQRLQARIQRGQNRYCQYVSICKIPFSDKNKKPKNSIKKNTIGNSIFNSIKIINKPVFFKSIEFLPIVVFVACHDNESEHREKESQSSQSQIPSLQQVLSLPPP